MTDQPVLLTSFLAKEWLSEDERELYSRPIWDELCHAMQAIASGEVVCVRRDQLPTAAEAYSLLSMFGYTGCWPDEAQTAYAKLQALAGTSV